MKTTFGKYSQLFPLLIVSAFSINAQASTYFYADKGIDYAINDTNPLLAKVSFNTAQNFSFAGASVSGDCAGQHLCHFTFTVDSISDAYIPAQGPVGLSVAPDGRATSIYSGPPVSILISGSYTYDYFKLGQTISISQEFSTITAVDVSNPVIDVWDFPSSVHITQGYGVKFSTAIVNFKDSYLSCNSMQSDDDCGDGEMGSEGFNAYVSGIVDARGARSYLSVEAYNLVQPVPVPAAAWLFGSGLIVLANSSRKRKAS